MKKFLIQTIAFSLISSVIFMLVITKADGYTDGYYKKFTSPKQSNLIIGTSRAAQGLLPEVMNPILQAEIFNYAFSVMHSPFGPTYLESIKRKLNSKTTDGIFIVTVDPWSISSWTKTPNDIETFREKNSALENTKFVNINPNPWYIYNNWGRNFYELLKNKPGPVFVHKDGWVEVNTNMDSIAFNERLIAKVISYRNENLIKYNYSSVRLDYLKKTILFLRKHGKVFLVRMPIHPEILKIDNELLPNFDLKINKLSKLTQGYLDLNKNNTDFEYTDGNHLYKDCGRIVSKIVAKWVSENSDTKPSVTLHLTKESK